ncbi:uncharacterized protein LOC128231335 isoform X1 [Mya arenaria]|uniref:uncharacterized protein LOC128231335 isoform X1 n=1 Tax=Mya arenaria TaxID=6604 RepID=UPI0022E2115E|nr:uncharacterized protein LOC128231335 isoform X1 [Mya arenaria]
MGVDIQTYRVRIGTNKFANGTDVVLLQRCVNFSAGLKAVGAVTFIVMLLLMAGIEPNPGPPKKGMQTISDEDSSGDEEERQLKAERAQKKEMRRIQRQQKQLQQEQQTDKTENISSNIVRATTRQHTAPNGPINQQSPCTIGDANNTQKESGEPGFETTSDEDSSDDEEARQLKAERAQKKEMKRLKGQLENIQKDQHSYTKEDISSKIVHVTTTQHKEPNVPVKHQSAFTKSDVFPAKKVSGVTGLQTLSDEDSLDDKETRQLNAEMAQKMEMIRLKRKQEKMHNDRSNIVQGMQTVSDEDSSKDKEARQLKTELAQNIEMRPLKRQQEKMQKKPHTDKAEDISSNVVQAELVQKMEKTRISSQQEKKEKKPHTVKTEEFSSNIVEGVQTVSDEDSSEDKEARQLKTELAQNIEMRRPKRQQEKMQKEPHTDKAEDISSNVVQVTTTQHKKPNFPAKHQSTLTKSDAFPTKKESGVQGVQMISDENSSDDEETKRFKAEQEKMDKEPHTDKPEDIYSTSNIVQDLQTISDEGYADVDEARQLKSELSQKKEMRRKEPHTDITEEISSNIVQVTTTQSTLTKSDAFPTEKESGVQGVQMLSDENSSDDKETKHFKAEQDKMEKEPHGDKTEDISSTSNIVQERREDIPKLLRRLGLEEHSRHKPITVKEAVVVNTKELNTEEMPLSQKPWVMLRGIISVNSNARDNNSTMHTSNSRESPEPPAHTKGNIRSRFGKAKTKPVSKPDVVSQMDIFMATYLCCEPKLRQILFRNMFLCKQAIPFIYNELHSAKYSVAVWPLKPLVFYTGTAMFKEEHVLDMKTRVVSFARIGRPKVSKSQMLNCIISNESNAYATFYAHDCPGGMIPREIVGFVEMFWLQQSTNTALPNNIPLTLLNIRGDIRNDISRTCVDFIESISDCIILFLDTTQRKEVLTFFKRKLPACRLILYFTDCLSENNNEETFADIEEILNVLHLPDESIQEHSLDKNFFHNTTDLVKHIFKYVRTSEDICVLNRIKSVCNAHIKLDTDNEQCKQGTELALEVLKVMKTELICKIEQEKTLSSDICLFKYCKQYLTPVSYCVTKKLSQVLKERKRAHALENKSSLDEKVLQLRSEQLQITDTVKTFILCLSKANRSPIIRQYFLANLRALLYNESKSFLPSMKIEKSKVRSDYIDLKAKDPDKKENIERLQNCLAMLDLDIENATFGVEHLFREVGHICDSSQHNQTCLTDLPSTEDIASTVADLVLDGETLEIIDGDNVFLASKWIAMVFNEIDKKNENWTSYDIKCSRTSELRQINYVKFYVWNSFHCQLRSLHKRNKRTTIAC